MSQNKNYIKGMYANNRINNFNNSETNISFTDEAIDSLKSLPKDEKGYRKITITPQKNDPSKSSVYENTYIPRSNAGDNSNSSLPF